MTTDVCHEVRVKSITQEAEGIHTFVLVPLPGKDLPRFTAGSHIDVHMRAGLVRSYSLVNSCADRNSYVLGVARCVDSRGGSNYMFDEVRVGQTLKISAPRNNFALDENAPRSVLIAGGIGITPIWCMLQRLQSLGRPWTLHYCARSHVNAAFIEEIEAMPRQTSGELVLHFDDEMGGARPDIARVVAQASPDAHLYCCGPQPMLDAFQAATSARPSETVHLEYFGAREEAALEGGYRVILARSGKTIAVTAGKTILDALLEASVDVQYGCTQGVCGTCEVPVLAGKPDHRDSILTAAARASNQTILVCCSGAKSSTLTLDI
jgi:vanillate O-demethylase ferredoxin subunit